MLDNLITMICIGVLGGAGTGLFLGLVACIIGGCAGAVLMGSLYIYAENKASVQTHTIESELIRKKQTRG